MKTTIETINATINTLETIIKNNMVIMIDTDDTNLENINNTLVNEVEALETLLGKLSRESFSTVAETVEPELSVKHQPVIEDVKPVIKPSEFKITLEDIYRVYPKDMVDDIKSLSEKFDFTYVASRNSLDKIYEMVNYIRKESVNLEYQRPNEMVEVYLLLNMGRKVNVKQMVECFVLTPPTRRLERSPEKYEHKKFMLLQDVIHMAGDKCEDFRRVLKRVHERTNTPMIISDELKGCRYFSQYTEETTEQ